MHPAHGAARKPMYGPYGHGNCPAGGQYGPGIHGCAIDSNFQAGAPYRMQAARFEPDRKVKNDTLRKFSGSINEYQMWRDRIVDHLCRTNRHWRMILETLQVWQTPVTKEWLHTQSHAGHGGWEISEILEGFLIEWLSDSL